MICHSGDTSTVHSKMSISEHTRNTAEAKRVHAVPVSE